MFACVCGLKIRDTADYKSALLALAQKYAFFTRRNDPLSCRLQSVLLQHSSHTFRRVTIRKEKPYGLKGGVTGKTGNQYILSVEGKKIKLKGMDGTSVNAGDRLIIETPGGGGFGKK